MNRTELARKLARIAGNTPKGAGLRSAHRAVRPAEDHAHVHAGQETPAAAIEHRVAILSASVGALLVGEDGSDPAKRAVVPDAVVMISTWAVIQLFN